MSCEAQRQQDEMFCARCNMRWDLDGDPAQCGKEARAARARLEAGVMCPEECSQSGHGPDEAELKTFRELTERILGGLDGG